MRLAFYSTMTGAPWGGSEELWSRAAAVLLARDHQMHVNYAHNRCAASPLVKLAAAGAHVHYRRRRAYGRTVGSLLKRLPLALHPHKSWLQRIAPHCLLVSMGSHVDDISVATTCQAMGIPYLLLVQAAGPHEWIDRRSLAEQRAAYGHARQVFFVSAQNRDIVEANLGLDLSASTIVDNPFNVAADAAPAWPSSDAVWKLASVARLHFQAKGQDILLQTLRQPKWRHRPVEVTLWGADGGSQGAIEAMISLYDLERRVKLGAYAEDIERLWGEHHALVLPSRFEGNPLALIEAMLCGRPVITTDVGRAAELVDDNQSGFIAAGSTISSFDEALERAWQRRHDWQSIGALAARTIRQRHSLQPAEVFADAVLNAGRGGAALRSRAA